MHSCQHIALVILKFWVGTASPRPSYMAQHGATHECGWMDFIRKPRRRSCFFQKLYLSILVSLSTKHILPLLRRICCLPPLNYNQKVNWFWGLPAPWRPPLIEIPSCEETKASNLSALHRLPWNRALFTSRSQKKHIHQTKSLFEKSYLFPYHPFLVSIFHLFCK